MIPLLLLVFIGMVSPHTFYLYNVQLNINDTIYTYTYNFSIINVYNNYVDFNLTITGENYYYSSNYNVSINDPYPLPINYEVFNTTDLVFVKNVTISNTEMKEYSGIFNALGKYKIPVTAYFDNGSLYTLNGTYNGVSVYINAQNITLPTTTSQESSTLSNYVIPIIFAVVFIIAIVLLIKIGKI
ncbi:hypothetical protein DFR86_02360 [Acidianus sulfidivorans JP7]|uniref:Uncharacterized protein n=1 Tax=Acidianus sulfidivorans JP7 TaxID=619593 RepID=A0A2U9IKJ2_9CREN|nr:hypothetical protein [Acidianus sulfidivorans]AWR96505.1 hypothetical protein DFR86_02360 [Acidianus sulfidivorans JP7]